MTKFINTERLNKLIERAKELHIELTHVESHTFNAEESWNGVDKYTQRTLGELRVFVAQFDHLSAETPVSAVYEREEKGLAVQEHTSKDIVTLEKEIDDRESQIAAHDRYERSLLATLKRKYE